MTIGDDDDDGFPASSDESCDGQRHGTMVFPSRQNCAIIRRVIRPLTFLTVASLSLAVACGSKPWRVQSTVMNPDGAAVGRCTKVISPDETAQRFICRQGDGPYACFEEIAGTRRLSNRDLGESACRSALSAAKDAGD